MIDDRKEGELSAEVSREFRSFSFKYGIARYPSVYVLDSEGEVIFTKVGYDGKGPNRYLESLESLFEQADIQFSSR